MATQTRPAKPPTRDLFDESTMTFGEHLEALRIHVLKALAGLVVATLVSLMFGESVVRFISVPINEALTNYGLEGAAVDDMKGFDGWEWFKGQMGMRTRVVAPPTAAELAPNVLDVSVRRSDLARVLRLPIPAPKPAKASAGGKAAVDDKTAPEEWITLPMRSPFFAQMRAADQRTLKPVTFNVQEAFMTYMKVSLVSGFVLASPWIFFQVWQFVAAGLYPSERKYVHVYLPFSLGLFLGGAVFCYYLVLPYVLDFLLGFNAKLGVQPQIRLSEWISFALLLPVMFGVSFQLPLVMLFLERLHILDVKTYREKRRIAILVIAVLSMFLTPSPDPMSMLLMMSPLLALYELGIRLCDLRSANDSSPFGAPA